MLYFIMMSVVMLNVVVPGKESQLQHQEKCVWMKCFLKKYYGALKLVEAFNRWSVLRTNVVR
jgi:hypothetical protein